MYYVVGGLQLIPKTRDTACWYASAQMLIRWRRTSRPTGREPLADPSEDILLAQWRGMDTGMSDEMIVALAKHMGLRSVPQTPPTEAAIERWLVAYGPLWVKAGMHAVVTAGIRPGEAMVFDPAPANRGSIGWRRLAGWCIAGEAGGGATPPRASVFLHCPG